MANLTLASSTFLPLADAYTNTPGRYWKHYNVGYPQYDIQEITAPGVQGKAVKRLGYRGRLIVAELEYVGASAQACNDLIDADMIDCINNFVTLGIPDYSSFENCWVLSLTALSIPQITESGTYFLPAALSAEQKRE